MSSKEQYRRLLTDWLKGHAIAVQFIEEVSDVAHFFDDLVDQDTMITTITATNTLSSICVSLPRNKFYAENFAMLNTLVQQSILNWHIANTLERTDNEADKMIAFGLRSSYVDLITMSASIIAGHDWAVAVGCEARRLAGSEGFAKYLASLAKEKRADVLLGGPHGIM